MIACRIKFHLFERRAIIRASKGALYTIGGMPDHERLCLRRRPDTTAPDLMRTLKARSSLWVHQDRRASRALGGGSMQSRHLLGRMQSHPTRRRAIGRRPLFSLITDL
jgi:hypothetical protein